MKDFNTQTINRWGKRQPRLMVDSMRQEIWQHETIQPCWEIKPKFVKSNNNSPTSVDLEMGVTYLILNIEQTLLLDRLWFFIVFIDVCYCRINPKCRYYFVNEIEYWRSTHAYGRVSSLDVATLHTPYNMALNTNV